MINIELDFFDRAKELNETMLEYRGNTLLSFKGAARVRVDGVEVFGSLCGIDTTIAVENCKSFVKENTNF